MNERSKDILYKIAEGNSFQLQMFKPLTGGDINDVFLLESKSEKFVAKLNNAREFPDMFEAEMNGLEHLSSPGVIDVPKPIATGVVEDQTYLLLEYKAEGNKTEDFWQKFGHQLANLHKVTRNTFGLDTDNYLGSLPQYNDSKDSAAEFFIEMRIKPQLRIAEDRGYDLRVSESFFKNCEKVIPNEKPALVHGDLWSGNYLVNSNGDPCIIDPAVAFAPREMDLAMMKLFGGFRSDLFNAYYESFPLEEDFDHRIELYQLYYLLMHLNVFGNSYKSQVLSIIQKFS